MITQLSKTIKTLLYASIALNLIDIALHVATDQVEPLRIAGNIIIVIASALVFSKWHPTALLAIGLIAYLTLNSIFIVMNGIGVAGIMFVALTSVLTLSSVFLHKARIKKL